MNLQKDNTPLAAGIITLAVLMLALGDAAIKGMSVDLVLWQIFVLRSLAALPVLWVVLRFVMKQSRLMPKSIGWVAARSLMLTFMWVLYYAALPYLDLSVAAAAYYTLPIFITLFSAWFARERVPPKGWLAVFLGFVGVLVILRPVSDGFTPYALLPLISAVLYALSMILTRTKCRGEDPLVLSAALNVGFVVVGTSATVLLPIFGGNDMDLGFLASDWSPMDGYAAEAIGLMVVAILVGSIGAAVAYQIGKPSVVGTFDFSYVGFATLAGVVFFGERPDIWSLLGIALIAAAGLIALRE